MKKGLKKKKSLKKKSKWTLAIVGMFLLAVFLSLLGCLTEQNKNPTEWKFYLLLTGIVFSLGVIILGIILGKKR